MKNKIKKERIFQIWFIIIMINFNLSSRVLQVVMCPILLANLKPTVIHCFWFNLEFCQPVQSSGDESESSNSPRRSLFILNRIVLYFQM